MRVRPASLKVRALHWLAQREHSPQELRRKLLRLLPQGSADEGGADGYPAPKADATSDVSPLSAEAEVDALLAWLTAQGYLSTDRFVESRINARQSRFGNLHIRHELRQHGLQLDAPARQALQASEAQRALAVWQRKFGQAAQNARQRLQQLRFLAGRGFSADVARRVVAAAGATAAQTDELTGLDDPDDAQSD